MSAGEKHFSEAELEILSARNPFAKLLWMILAIALRNKHRQISFSRKRETKTISISLDNEFEMAPPSRGMFSILVRMLRRIGRNAAKNKQSCFKFVCVETGEEQSMDWFINYDTGHNPLDELNALMHELLEEYRANFYEKSRKAVKRVEKAIAWLLLALIFFSHFAMVFAVL